MTAELRVRFSLAKSLALYRERPGGRDASPKAILCGGRGVRDTAICSKPYEAMGIEWLNRSCDAGKTVRCLIRDALTELVWLQQRDGTRWRAAKRAIGRLGEHTKSVDGEAVQLFAPGLHQLGPCL